MDFDELFPGRFLKSGEFKGKDVCLTIKDIRLEDLPQEGGKTRKRGIVSFRETERDLVLNRTNGECLKAMFGRHTRNWIGKRIVFYPAPHRNPITKEEGTAIRVRGSLDIERDITFDLRLPMRKAQKVTLRALGQGSQQRQQTQHQNQREEQRQ